MSPGNPIPSRKPGCGSVALVGAGPGDPGLLTIRGRDLIERADVIVYDQLGAPTLLGLARPDAELIDVGKRAGKHTMPQDEINNLLVDRARSGKSVVRLKGGDPLVFGRGGEEMETLADAGVRFEMVPGVSSAIAGPGYAGIPVTHRSCTPAMAIITGHEADDPENGQFPWTSLAGIGTVIILMGVGRLRQIAQRLVEAGKPATTAVAVIEQATTPDQRTITGTLADIADRATAAGVKPPALIVVGDVVSYHDRLNWFERRPLFGRTIVVTRSRAQASDLVTALNVLGAKVLVAPAIRIERLHPNPALDAFFRDFDRYRDLVFTSVNGVEGFIAGLLERGLDLRRLAGKNLICIGPATAEVFRQRSISPDFVPETYVAESLVPWFQARPPASVAVLRAEEAREMLPQALRELGCEVEIVPLYRTMRGEPAEPALIEALRAGKVDAVTFTSSSTVERFLELIAPSGLDPKTIPGVAIGPITAETAKRCGVPLLAQALTYTIPGLVQTLLELFEKRGETATPNR